jgi:hypothetical protein
MLLRLSLRILEKHVNYNFLNFVVFVLGKVFIYLDNRSRMMSSGVLLLLDFLPDSKIPEGVFEIANEMRSSTVVISKTWKARNQAKISGNSEPEIRVLYFDSKAEETAKKAVSLIGMQYNKLYRSPAELPSGTNSMRPLYRAIKNCLFLSEKKILYMQKKRRSQFYREI